MERNKALFVAFPGNEIDQAESIATIDRGFQCWNLKRFTRDKFIETLKQAIPPVNDNVLSNYKSEDSGDPRFGISDTTFGSCTWGLFVPLAPGDGGMFAAGETLFLLELYTLTFPLPVCYGSDFGITIESGRKSLSAPSASLHAHRHSRVDRPEFVSFFEMLSPQAQYGAWNGNRVQRWSQEDWRLFAAALLFRGLGTYDDGKDAFGWQRESADMACVLEALFTAGDSQNEEIGYRLRKRLAVLLSRRFPDIEKDIKNLYIQRSAFVHGSFFAQMAKESKKRNHNLPLPDFYALELARQYVRWALVSYLRLAQIICTNPDRYKGRRRVIDLLEAAIIDINLRNAILEDLESVFALLSA